jgi:hypothetical protein
MNRRITELTLQVVAAIAFVGVAFSPARAQAILSLDHLTLGSKITITDKLPNTVLTDTVTMPSSGCPCRVRVDYSLYNEANCVNTAGAEASTWVTDGTNNFASYVMVMTYIQLDAASGAFSPVTYSNNQVVTFTLDLEQTKACGSTSQWYVYPSSSPPGQENSYFDVAVMPSN